AHEPVAATGARVQDAVLDRPYRALGGLGEVIPLARHPAAGRAVVGEERNEALFAGAGQSILRRQDTRQEKPQALLRHVSSPPKVEPRVATGLLDTPSILDEGLKQGPWSFIWSWFHIVTQGLHAPPPARGMMPEGMTPGRASSPFERLTN